MNNWTPGNLALLGKIADQQLAARMGIDKRAVWQKRTALGIPAVRQYPPRWTPETDARLGIDSDTVIAELLGISVVAVGNRRKRLGIPAPAYSRRDRMVAKFCVVCGKGFSHPAHQFRQKCCSRECSARRKTELRAVLHHAPARYCEICGRAFAPNASQLTCSTACRDKRRREYLVIRGMLFKHFYRTDPVFRRAVLERTAGALKSSPDRLRRTRQREAEWHYRQWHENPEYRALHKARLREWRRRTTHQKEARILRRILNEQSRTTD